MGLAATQIALMLTRRCDMACSHCSVASGPHIKDEPAEEDLVRRLQEAAAAGVRAVTLTGGEPMLREDVVLRLLHECRRLGVHARMVTDGFWGKTPADAKSRLQALRKAGLGVLTVSHDRYHAAFQSHEPVLNIARAAEELLFRIDIHFVRGADDSELARLVEPFEGLKHVRLRFYELQPVGRARTLPGETFRSETDGFCSTCAFPAITDDGRLLACNGPAYFTRPDNPLQVGSMKDASMQTLLERHWNDPVLDTIRNFGPSRLRDELRTIPGFERFPFREQYFGMCELCHHITNTPEAVSALRAKLAEPARVAERQAVSLLIQASRVQGPLSRQYVNSVGVGRVFHRLAWGESRQSTEEVEHVLGRADLDWSALAAYLTDCGLARPLANGVREPVMTRWAPPFFLDRMASRSTRDEERERRQRDALRRVADVLRTMGERAVLLGGSMLPLMTAAFPCRATANLDLHLPSSVAAALRGSLLKQGFCEAREPRGVAWSRSAPVLFDDVAVRFHERLMPAWWNLPEHDMLAHTSPVAGEVRDVFHILSTEGLLLHTGVQAAAHLYSYGLRTAWDLRWALTRSPVSDWERLAHWVGASKVPRAFWTTVGVLAEALELPIPKEFLCRAPADQRQVKLGTIARHLLFTAHEEPQNLNPFNKVGVLLFLQDSWPSRVGYLGTLLRPELTATPGEGNNRSASKRLAGLIPQMREAWLNWRGYRITLEQRRRMSGSG